LGVPAISDATIPLQAAEPARLSEDALAVAIGLARISHAGGQLDVGFGAI
jgi:hypothetical protein